jgi:hypothetical protein
MFVYSTLTVFVPKEFGCVEANGCYYSPHSKSDPLFPPDNNRAYMFGCDEVRLGNKKSSCCSLPSGGGGGGGGMFSRTPAIFSLVASTCKEISIAVVGCTARLSCDDVCESV